MMMINKQKKNIKIIKKLMMIIPQLSSILRKNKLGVKEEA